MYNDFIKQQEQSVCGLCIENLTFYFLLNRPLNPEDSIDVDITSFTTHKHAYAELFVCQHGEMHLKTSDGLLILQAGEAVIIPPSFQHNMDFASDNAIGAAVGFLYLHNNTNHTHDIYTNFSHLFHLSSPYFIHGQLEFCKNIVSILNHLDKLSPWLVALSLFQQLALYTHPGKNAIVVSNTPSFPNTIDCDLSRHCKLDHIINCCFMQNFTTADIADFLNISSRQLTRFVLKHYGTTLHQAITGKRILTAEQMLVKTDLSIEKIAITVGFTTIASLYREFQKKHSMTPAQYREQHTDFDHYTTDLSPLPKKIGSIINVGVYD